MHFDSGCISGQPQHGKHSWRILTVNAYATGPDRNRPREPTPAKQQTEDALLAAMLDLSQYNIPTNTILREALRKKGFNATVVCTRHLTYKTMDPCVEAQRYIAETWIS
jgi:hypothetical protein